MEKSSVLFIGWYLLWLDNIGLVYYTRDKISIWFYQGFLNGFAIYYDLCFPEMALKNKFRHIIHALPLHVYNS